MRRSLGLLVKGLRSGIIGKSRRDWEETVSNALTDAEARKSSRQEDSHNRVYVRKEFTPVEEVFPLKDAKRWEGLPQNMTTQVARNDDKTHVVKVAVLGPPNSGKSSLVNAMTTTHVSATSQ